MTWRSALLSLGSLAARAFRWLVLDEGSTRPLGILRIGLVALLWSRFGIEFIWYRCKDDVFLVTSTVFFLLSPLYALGLWTRVLKWVFAGLAAFIPFGLGIWRHHEPFLHHHVALLCAAVAILAFTPCERSYSLDRYLLAKRLWPRRPPPERGPLYGQRLLCMLVSSVYLFGAYAKMHASYLSGARNTHHLMAYYFDSDLPSVPFFDELMMLGAVFTVVLELALAFGLYFRRLQPPLIVVGVLFHVVLYVLLPVATFSATICFLYLAYLDPDRVARAIDRMHGQD